MQTNIIFLSVCKQFYQKGSVSMCFFKSFCKTKICVCILTHSFHLYAHGWHTVVQIFKKKTLRRLWSRNYPSDLLLVFKYHTFGHKLLFSVEKSEYLAFDLVIFLYLYAKLLVYRMQIYMQSKTSIQLSRCISKRISLTTYNFMLQNQQI